MENTSNTISALDGRKVTLSTTVPAWLDGRIDDMASARLVSKSVFLRQLLLDHVRQVRPSRASAAAAAAE